MRKTLLLASLVAFSSCTCVDGNNENSGNNLVDGGPDAEGDDADTSGDMSASSVECGDPDVMTAEVAGWEVRLYAEDGHWEAENSDGTLLQSGPSCSEPVVRIGDGSPLVRADFGAFDFDFDENYDWAEQARAVPEWTTLRGVQLVYEMEGEFYVQLDFVEREGNLQIRAQEIFRGLPENSAAPAPQDSLEFSVVCGADESFFGLGTQATGMDLRGRSYPLWTQEQGNSKPEGGGSFPLNNIPEAAYAPMGVWHSTSGYSAVVIHDGFTELDLCESVPDQVRIRSHRANPGFVAVTGTPPERVTAVTEYTGRVRSSVPDWTFGLWVDSVTGPDRLAEVTSALRDNGIPASAIWSEDWIGGDSGQFGFRLTYDWVWDEEQYPDLPTLVDGLHADGFAFLGYFNPFIPEPTSIWDPANENGYTIEDENGEVVTFIDPAFRTATMVDLFNPDAADWLAEYQRAAVVDIGMDGWMADFAEWYPKDAVDFWYRHNLYPLEWQRQNDLNLDSAKNEIGEPNNYVFFARSGWASTEGGTGGIVPTMWGGDQNTTWGYDDGFPTIIPIGTHVGLSGVPIFGSDIAGYNSVGPIENTDKELWFRWASAAAFHPLMRTHHGGDECANWNFDRDPETLDHIRRWSTIHSMLLPEFQRLHEDAVTQGWPITRHPWLVEPDSPELWTGDQYQWFLGEDILVAPVLTEGATSRDVVLPGENWWPLFGTNYLFEDRATVDTAVTEVPVFVRPGRALTLLMDAPDSFYGATSADVTDLNDVAGAYRVALYPDADGSAETRGEIPVAVGGRDLEQFDTSVVSFNGASLQPCPAQPTESCVEGVDVRLIGVTAGSVVAAGATIDVDAPEPVDLVIGIGGAPWGVIGVPTTFTENPDAPSWCPPEPE